MQALRNHVGSDIELMPARTPANQHSLEFWQDWMGRLSELSPKGQRTELSDGVWCHRDGLAVEYGFEPTDDVHTFLKSMTKGKQMLEEMLGVRLAPVDSFAVEPIINLPRAQPFLEMGCSPDMRVEDGQILHRRVPPDVERKPIRECGGHIHVSLPSIVRQEVMLTAAFVEEMDRLLYPVDANLVTWYRQSKVFRITEYGVEYRSLGASRLFGKSGRRLLLSVFDLVRKTWEEWS